MRHYKKRVYADKQWTCPRCGSSVLQSERHRDVGGHLAKHCGCSVRVNHVLTPEQMAEHTRQRKIAFKRKYHAQAAAKVGRIPITRRVNRYLHDAHVICFKQHQAEVKIALSGLHDAHIKKYHQALKARASSAKRYWTNPTAQRERVSLRKEQLPDSYVIQNLKAMGIQPNQITPPLVALKRESMQYRRLSNSIKTTIKTQFKENK